MSIQQASQIINLEYQQGIQGVSSDYPTLSYEELIDLIETAWETLEAEGC